MKAEDILCPDSFSKAFNALPDAPVMPAYELAGGERVTISRVLPDGGAVTDTGRWLSEPEVKAARRVSQ